MSTGTDMFHLPKIEEGSTAWSAMQDFLDDEFRARVREDARAVMSERGVDLPPAMNVEVRESTDEVFYLAFPPDPNVDLSDESLGMVAGGKSASTIGSASSASTAGSICGTASTGGSASSMASVASASSAS